MRRADYYEKAITFVLDQEQVKKAIDGREKKGYKPIGVNMRLIFSESRNRYFIQVNFDYWKQYENHNLKEDLIVWITRDQGKYTFHSMKDVYEVPNGLSN